jgi:hypothetical protein
MDSPIHTPVRSILTLDDATINQVAQTVVPLREERFVDLGRGLSARLPGNAYVEPWQQFALAIISTAMGDRPVYFASSGNAAGQLGLTPFLVRQGLAFRLHEGPFNPDAMGDVVELAPSAFTNVTGIYLDPLRTQRLASEVFMHRNGLPDEWPRWPWRAVLGIPSYYSWVHYALYEWATMENDTERADYNLDRVEAWARLRGEG